MVREIVKSAGNSYTLNLPNEMVGKTVEVIAFEIVEEKQNTTTSSIENLNSIMQRYAQYPSTSHHNYKFNRDEANDYE
jgi:hypothetical protein